MTTRDTRRGAVRRLLVAASLAMIALSAWVAVPTAAAADRLPNLKAERPTDFRIVFSNGRRLLRFTSVVVNAGGGPMEVLATRPSSSSPWRVRQVIDNDTGGQRGVDTEATLRYAGDGHNHWHVRQVMGYHLWSSKVTRSDRKVGFCFFDTDRRVPSLPRSPSSPHYRESWCGGRTALTSRTGISVGWADRYQWSLPFQFIDITGLPGGVYTVRAATDPNDWFRESNETDGCAFARVRIGSSGSAVSVVSSGRGCINDWENATFSSSIAWAFEAGITGGCEFDMYCPAEPVTRAQMAMFIDRAMELPPTVVNFFWDDEGITGEGSINRLAAAEITGGCAEHRFCPRANVTRGEMASFLARALDLPPATEPDHFSDDDGSTHEAAIDSLVEAGITGGCGPGRYCPNASVTRGQMAAFLFRSFANPPPED